MGAGAQTVVTTNTIRHPSNGDRRDPAARRRGPSGARNLNAGRFYGPIRRAFIFAS